MNITTSNMDRSPVTETPSRVCAIDAFRGLFVLLAVLQLFVVSGLREWCSGWLVSQFEPSIWHGMKLVDFIEPGFLFVMGISASYSVDSRRKRGETRPQILLHLVQRCIGLCVIGFFLENWIPTYWPEIRWTGIYQRLAICNLCVGFFCCYLESSTRLGLACFCLVNYGFAFEAFRVPPHPPVVSVQTHVTNVKQYMNPYSMEYNLAAYIDQNVLPGRKYFGTWDRYSLLSILPAFVIALLGSCSGPFFLQNSTKRAGTVSRLLLMSGCAILGYFVSLVQPVNAILLTPAFILSAFSLYGFILVVLSRYVDDTNSYFISRGLQLFGRQALPLMFIAHFVAAGSTAIATQTSLGWFQFSLLQTLIAIWSISGLLLISSWMNRKGILVRL